MRPITLLKILLSIPIGIGLAYPFFVPGASGGILGEMQILGPTGTVAAAVAFFGLVALYARDLSTTLRLVSPKSRQADPKSVWFMLLLPYNFIEDFFIVGNIAKSLKAEASLNPALKAFSSFGLFSGLGWCITQVISLIPNDVGSVAGLLALFFWIWHWVFIRRIIRALINSHAS